MPSFRTKRPVPFTSQQMFALVADVERYPEFVPLCEGLRVKSRKADGDKQVIVAQMDVGYGAIRESFTSQVTLDPARYLVTVEYIDGPFRYLENRWTFEPADGGCEVDFFISYELKSALLQIMVGAVFEKAFRRFTEAFETRAHQVYGTPRPDKLSPV